MNYSFGRSINWANVYYIASVLTRSGRGSNLVKSNLKYHKVFSTALDSYKKLNPKEKKEVKKFIGSRGISDVNTYFKEWNYNLRF